MARSAGNASPLVKERNTESGPLWGSLRANRWAASAALRRPTIGLVMAAPTRLAGWPPSDSLSEALSGFGLVSHDGYVSHTRGCAEQEPSGQGAATHEPACISCRCAPSKGEMS